MKTRSTVRAKVWLERDGNPVLGKGRAQLLKEIEKTGSIRRAAEALGMSYRYAWGMLAKISEASGQQIVESRRGGKAGGSSRLSDHGKGLLEAYSQAERASLDSERYEIKCVVASVEDGRVKMCSVRGEEITLAVEGGDLAKEVSEGEEIILRFY